MQRPRGLIYLITDALILTTLTVGVCRALLASPDDADLTRWRREISAQVSEHEARLRELDRYRDTLDALRLGERLSRIEATQDATFNLLFAIATAVGVMVAKDLLVFLRGTRNGRPARSS